LINWREIPFFRLLFPLIAGIIIANWVNVALPWLTVLLILLFLGFILLNQFSIDYRYRWLSGLIINVFIFVFGYQICYHHNEINQANHFKFHIEEEDIFSVKIMKPPVLKGSLQMEVKMLTLEKDNSKSVSGNLLVYQMPDSINQQFEYGDILLCKGKINTIAAPSNPHAFDFKRYYHFQNIHHQSFINTENIQLISKGNGNPIYNLAFKIRKRFVGILEKHLTSADELAVGSALIIGYRDTITDEVKQAYMGTGAMHVLAVSGLHVGIIMQFLELFLSFFSFKNKSWKWVKLSLILVGLWSFVLITGASPSVMRAATMFSFVVIGKRLKFTGNIYNTLAVSAVCLIIYNPFIIADIGFQLSYLAVIGIVYFHKKVHYLWYIKNPIGNKIWELTAVGIAAQIATLPLTLFYFHQFPVYFFLTGCVVVIGAGFILFLGISLLIFELIIPLIATPIGVILDWVIWMMNAFVFFIEQLPFALITGIWISGFMMFLLYTWIASLSISLEFKKSKLFMASLGILLLFFMNRSWYQYHNSAQRSITVYDVPKMSVIDFMSNQKTITISDEQINHKKLQYITQNNRWANGINKNNIVDAYNQNSNYWKSEKPMIQFFDKKMLIIEDFFNPSQLYVDQLDYVLVKNNPTVDILEMTQSLAPGLVIFDSSNKKLMVDKWVAICVEHGIQYFDTRSMGAFQVKF